MARAWLPGLAAASFLLLGACGDGAAPPAQPKAAPTPTPSVSASRQARADPSSSPRIDSLPDPKTIPDSATGLANGDFVPDLALDDLINGRPYKLGDSIGPKASGVTKVAVVGFVASWCGPCRASLPFLKQMEELYPGDLEVVLITTDTDRDAMELEAAHVRKAGLDAPVLAPTSDDLRAWLGHRRSVPHFFIINRAGEVLVQDRGFGKKVKRMLPGQINYALKHPEYVMRTKKKAAPKGG